MDITGNSVGEYIAKLEIINVVHVLDNQYIIMCTSKAIKIWNTINKDIISHTVPGMIGAQMIIVSRNGHQVVYTVGDDEMYIFRIKNAIEWKFAGMIQVEAEITCCCDSPDGRFIITGDRNCNVKIWCVETGKLVEVLLKSQDDERLYLISHTILYSPDNLQLIYSDGEIIRIYDMVSMKLVRDLHPEVMPGIRLRINNIEYSPDSKHIICRLLNDAIMKVNMDTFKQSIVVSGYKLFAPNSNFKVGYVTNYETAMIYKKYLYE
jgi:WD40 repeat protein